MFDLLLKDVESKHEHLNSRVTPEQYRTTIEEFLAGLSLEVESLPDVARAILGAGIFSEAAMDIEYGFTRPDENGLTFFGIGLGTYYIRQEKRDYELSLNVSLNRDFISRHRVHPAAIEIGVEVRGLNGRKSFESLYSNYTGQTVYLLEQNGFEFFTSYCSEVVGKYKGKSIKHKIAECLSDPDFNNCFSIHRSVSKDMSNTELIKSFLAAAAIYGGCIIATDNRKSHYSTYEKSLARLL